MPLKDSLSKDVVSIYMITSNTKAFLRTQLFPFDAGFMMGVSRLILVYRVIAEEAVLCSIPFDTTRSVLGLQKPQFFNALN